MVLWKRKLQSFFIEDNYNIGNGWYIEAYLNKLVFKLNDTNINLATVEFSENGISFEGDKLIGESEGDVRYTLKSELPLNVVDNLSNSREYIKFNNIMGLNQV